MEGGKHPTVNKCRKTLRLAQKGNQGENNGIKKMGEKEFE
jgi:hypothetical protein